MWISLLKGKKSFGGAEAYVLDETYEILLKMHRLLWSLPFRHFALPWLPNWNIHAMLLCNLLGGVFRGEGFLCFVQEVS